MAFEIGIMTFGEITEDPATGRRPSPRQRVRETTEAIRLTSAVTVLGSEDPVRVWEQYATIDLLSSGRAEIIAGRGSYTESFPLFGYDLDDYADLFREKLDLLLEIRARNPLTWQGRFRAP